MRGFKYSENDSSEKILPLKQQTRVIMIDRKKYIAVSGLFIPSLILTPTILDLSQTVYPQSLILTPTILDLSQTV